MLCTVFAAADEAHCLLALRQEITAIHTAQGCQNFIVGAKEVPIRKGLVVSRDCSGARDDLIRLLCRRQIMIVKFPAELASAAATDIAESGNDSSDGALGHPDERQTEILVQRPR